MSYLEGSEYDKIVVDKSPMEILWSLMSIERPCDEEVNLTSEHWYAINLAISLLMDTVGIQYNYKEKTTGIYQPELRPCNGPKRLERVVTKKKI